MINIVSVIIYVIHVSIHILKILLDFLWDVLNLIILFGILFSIITITALHILINEGMAQEKGITSIDPKSVTNPTLQHTSTEGYRYAKGYWN